LEVTGTTPAVPAGPVVKLISGTVVLVLTVAVVLELGMNSRCRW
jgi:hypothetical protein